MPELVGVPHEEWEELLENYRMLGPTGRRVLRMLAKRLSDGRSVYGDDFTRDRNWTSEALEEVLDSQVYLAIELARIGG
jgi:hypothetical protein